MRPDGVSCPLADLYDWQDRGHLAVQLASLLGLRVIATVRTPDEASYLDDLNTKIGALAIVCMEQSLPVKCCLAKEPTNSLLIQSCCYTCFESVLCLNSCCLAARVINLTTTGLLEAVLEETGGLGVDAILDPTGETPDVSPLRAGYSS